MTYTVFIYSTHWCVTMSNLGAQPLSYAPLRVARHAWPIQPPQAYVNINLFAAAIW